MGSDRKYSPIYHSGLEVIGQHDAPEVVPGSSPPINRKSSLLNPEPYHAAPHYYTDKQEHGNYYQRPESVAPEYFEGGRPSYIHTDVKDARVATQEVTGRQKERRCCGMRRKIFIIVVIVVAVLLCIGAIVGGVLGAILTKDE